MGRNLSILLKECGIQIPTSKTFSIIHDDFAIYLEGSNEKMKIKDLALKKNVNLKSLCDSLEEIHKITNFIEVTIPYKFELAIRTLVQVGFVEVSSNDVAVTLRL